MKNFKNIVLDSIPPENRNDLWLHQIDADEGKYELKIFATVKQGNKHFQKWITVGTGGYTPDSPTPTPSGRIDSWYVLNGVAEIQDWNESYLKNPITSISYPISSLKAGFVYLILNTNQSLKSVISPQTQENITGDFTENMYTITINNKSYKVYEVFNGIETESSYNITITQNG